MELSKAVRSAYFTALNGNIIFDSKVVPVFDAYALPDGTTYPYILLSSQTSNQLSIKRCKRYNASILIDILTGSTDPIGRSDAEDIAEQVDSIINPDTFIDIDLSDFGFQLGNTTRESDNDLSDKNNIYYIYRKLLTYSFLIVSGVNPLPQQPPVINSELSVYVFPNIPFLYQITATNNPSQFNASGLANGLAVNTDTGLIYGTPTSSVMNANIQATNGIGTGAAQLISKPYDGLPPTEPSNLVASNILYTQFMLSFTGSTFNGGYIGDGIDVYEFFKNGVYFTFDFGNSGGRLLQGLTPGETNLWKIRAKDIAGVYSDFSEEISVQQLA